MARPLTAEEAASVREARRAVQQMSARLEELLDALERVPALGDQGVAERVVKVENLLAVLRPMLEQRAERLLISVAHNHEGSPTHRSKAEMTEVQAIIEDARKLDPEFEQTLADATGPGRYEACAENRELAVAIDTIYGHGGADEEAGDVDFLGHFIRVGAFILSTDSTGFRTLTEYETEGEAEAAIAEVAEAEALHGDE